MASEIELKLDIDTVAADAIERSALLNGEPKLVEQRSTYFDTDDRALKAAGPRHPKNPSSSITP